MIEKWFRFRSLGWGKSGKMDSRIEIFAPTISALKNRTATLLVENQEAPIFSYVDRVEVEVAKGEEVAFSKMVLKDALDGDKFIEEMGLSELCQKLSGEGNNG